MDCYPFLHRHRGFSLTEMIVVIAVSTLLLEVITFSIVTIYKDNAYTFAQSAEVDTARRGLETWIQDAREMDYGAEGSYPIKVAEPNLVGFYSDIDPDAITEYIEYELSSTTLYRRVYKTTGYPAVYNVSPDETYTLSEYVQNDLNGIDTFYYFDSNGNEIADPSSQITDIRYVRAELIVNIDPIHDPGEFKLEGSAAMRNLKDNL